MSDSKCRHAHAVTLTTVQTRKLATNVTTLQCAESTVTEIVALYIYRVAQKSKPLPIFQKIVLKTANKIRFLRKVKV